MFIIKQSFKRLAIFSIFSVASIIAVSNIAIAFADDVAKKTNNDMGVVVQEEKFVDIYDANAGTTNTEVSNILDIKVSENQTVRVGLASKALELNYSNIAKSAELSVGFVDNKEVKVAEVTALVDEVKAEIAAEAEAKRQAQLKAKSYIETTTQGGLVDIAKPDPNYGKRVVKITGEDRRILENLVQGEAGNQGYIGAALVAQCLKDMYILGGYNSINSVRLNTGYAGSIKNPPSKEVKDAVAYVFDQGGYAVKHRVLYFYAPDICKSGFHESQNLIIHYKGHRFFDRWN